MTDRPLVRPAFLKGSLVAFLILLPLVAHSLWDYVETRRLRMALDAIQARGETITEQYRVPPGEAAQADRYYRAAAALASGFHPNPQGWFGRVLAAERSGELPVDAAAQLRVAVDEYDEALSFIDRAARLPFDGIAPGFSYSYVWGSLNDALRLAGLRSLVRAIDGDGDGAMDSIYSGIRIVRAIRTLLSIPLTWLASDVKRVVEYTGPSSDRLARVGEALAELDHENGLSIQLQLLRRMFYQSSSGRSRIGQQSWAAIVQRPWNVHRLNAQLELSARLVQASDAPWPQRIDDVIAIGQLYAPAGVQRSPTTQRENLTGIVMHTARQVATLRALRIVVALERYRRDHAEQIPESPAALVPAYLPNLPVDPFSGQPMCVKLESGGFTVYSVGSNRKDDGGDLTMSWLPVGGREAPDTGISIRYKR